MNPNKIILTIAVEQLIKSSKQLEWILSDSNSSTDKIKEMVRDEIVPIAACIKDLAKELTKKEAIYDGI